MMNIHSRHVPNKCGPYSSLCPVVLRPIRLRTCLKAVETAGTWEDVYTPLNDRKKEAPLMLPSIDAAQTVTLVRHGQSTWNAAGIVQGSTDFSVLTEKGIKQAQATGDMLSGEVFDHLWYSPLSRATDTARIVWGDRVGPQHCDPVLREIDLYSFQGLEKTEIKKIYASEHHTWRVAPEEFQLAGHYPVHETWYRASLAWHKILANGAAGGNGNPTAAASTPNNVVSIHSTLVVAHNNINQALIATALQLPVTFFRRLTQSNAAVSRLKFSPAGPGQPPEARLLCLNQSRSNPLSSGKDKVIARIILFVSPEDPESQEAAVALVQDTAVQHVVVLPANSGTYKLGQETMADAVQKRCRTSSGKTPHMHKLEEEAGSHMWKGLLKAASEQGGCNVVAILPDSQSVAGLTCSAFGLGQVARHKFAFALGSLTVFDFEASPLTTPAIAKCMNSTSHLQNVQLMPDSLTTGSLSDS